MPPTAYDVEYLAVPYKVVAPFVTSAAVSVLTFVLSKVAERRVGEKADDWKYSKARLVALSNWASDASQAVGAFLVPVLALEVIVSTKTPSWLIVFYSISAFLALCFGLIAVGVKQPVDWATKFWFNLPPAATLSFLINLAACLLVILLY
ncbi:hypothetical protein IM697_01645 [Streptomyces ferrugineus]|uniref:Uncharacterized protein n=1 Tax=Streptomyces ferrugineus TaxID=1413221 RepID=A0A7M2SLG9_9ACTN|nr:hypothetical protein [Streptomyces ferrugineus]QOV37196.1 hypothetical protein IM697_01645 [Streptomyces ferrugineus]